MFFLLLCGCESIKVDANKEEVKAGNNKQKFITGILITAPFLTKEKIILQGRPHKDPYHQEIIRQEYSTSIKF